MSLLRILKFIALHPLNRGGRLSVVFKFIRYQFATKLLESKFLVNWVNDAKFLVSKGETGLTGNLYCGLMEYEDMSFLLHYLRQDDKFYDIGANVGAYTILASGVIGADSVAFEPLPLTYDRLIDQIKINRIEHLVESNNSGVGDKADTLEFTNNLNCMNKVNTDPNNRDVTIVDVITLDDYYKPTKTSFVKIDVEGYEKFVLKGGVNFFFNENVSALVIELNGSGTSFGVEDNDVHKIITSFGFRPVSYEPFSRKLSPLESYELGGNTIYVKDIVSAQQRVTNSESVCIRTANNLEL
ncbi:FkbM family methyltransferase [Vibrio hepatarius]|uniref:FkbM family methyltransferase n=1 Tax=Vibrio hepatarius TaxID=171383 RepID=UPI001C098790|nr:FkbM family methyltransferase [Vibrio hepatarius]MBU2898370.1 FkbM family methyltransferase [Vibrio hepatarius]